MTTVFNFQKMISLLESVTKISLSSHPNPKTQSHDLIGIIKENQKIYFSPIPSLNLMSFVVIDFEELSSEYTVIRQGCFKLNASQSEIITCLVDFGLYDIKSQPALQYCLN